MLLQGITWSIITKVSPCTACLRGSRDGSTALRLYYLLVFIAARRKPPRGNPEYNDQVLGDNWCRAYLNSALRTLNSVKFIPLTDGLCFYPIRVV